MYLCTGQAFRLEKLLPILRVWYSNTGDCAGVFYCCGGAMSGGGAGGREAAELTHVNLICKCVLYDFVCMTSYV